MSSAWPVHLFVGSLFLPRKAVSTPWWAHTPSIALTEERSGWQSLELTTERSLGYEDPSLFGAGNYKYRVLSRSGLAPRFMMVATAHDVITHVLKESSLVGRVSTPNVNVAKLVRDLSSTPDTYSLGTVYARVDGYGQSLRSVVMYGDDLADARLFRDVLPRIAPYRVSLRHVLTKNELFTIGARGDVGFHCRGPESLDDVDKALTFLSTRNYMSWGLAPHVEG